MDTQALGWYETKNQDPALPCQILMTENLDILVKVYRTSTEGFMVITGQNRVHLPTMKAVKEWVEADLAVNESFNL